MSGGILLGAGDRVKQIQQRVHPDALDAHGRILRQQVFRHRIELVRIAEYVAAAGRIGVDVVEVEPVRAAGRLLRGELVGEGERLFPVCHGVLGEMFPKRFPEPGGGEFLFRCERLVSERRAVGFDLADLDPEEVFLLQGVSHLFRSPVQQFEDLLIRQQLPVVPDEGEVAVGDPFRVDLRLGGQPHFGGGLDNLRFGGAQDRGDPGGRDQFPVAPDHGLPAGGEMRINYRGASVSAGQFFDLHGDDSSVNVQSIREM